MKKVRKGIAEDPALVVGQLTTLSSTHGLLPLQVEDVIVPFVEPFHPILGELTPIPSEGKLCSLPDSCRRDFLSKLFLGQEKKKNKKIMQIHTND
jgi:hypothetical protein